MPKVNATAALADMTNNVPPPSAAKPKRPPNCWLMFRKSVATSWPAYTVLLGVPKDAPKPKLPEISALASAAWRGMSPAERQPYVDMANGEREEHARKYPDYKYAPTPKIQKENERAEKKRPGTSRKSKICGSPSASDSKHIKAASIFSSTHETKVELSHSATIDTSCTPTPTSQGIHSAGTSAPLLIPDQFNSADSSKWIGRTHWSTTYDDIFLPPNEYASKYLSNSIHLYSKEYLLSLGITI